MSFIPYGLQLFVLRPKLGVGRQGLEIYPCIKFRPPQWLSLLVIHAHTLPFSSLFMFVRSQNFISSPSYMFVSAADSEIHECNQNKNKNFENGYFNLITFPCM